MTDLIGQIVGDYRIEAPLRAGTTGPLFRARHVRLDRPAVIRMLDARLTAVPNFAARFTNALRRAAALRNEHIIEVADFGASDARYYVVMEAFAGDSLRAELDRRREQQASLPLASALDLAAQAAEGLAYAHQQGVIHGAITPANMLVRRDDAGDANTYTLKINDFGLAQVLPDEALHDPAYLSPEQCRGQEIDGRSDIYSLGVVLYELAVGSPPFKVTTVAEASAKHLRTAPTPPRRVRPQLPAALEAIILHCLAKQPEQRFADADTLADALREVSRSLPSTQTVQFTAQPTEPLPPMPAMDQPPPDLFLNDLLGAATVAAAAPQAWNAERMGVRVDQEQIGLTPGQAVIVPIHVTNNGPTADTITVSLEGVPGAWLRRQEPPMQLSPGAAATVALLVNVPRSSENVSGDYSVIVRARSAANPAESGTARMRWTVLPYEGTDLRVAPNNVSGRTGAEYRVSIRNEGNVPATYMLSVADDAQTFSYVMSQDHVTLDPGQTATVGLIIEAPSRMIGEPQPHRFDVRAEAPNQEPAVAQAQFMHVAAVPAWYPLAAVGVILLAILIGSLIRNGQTPDDVAVVPTALPTEAPTPTPEPGAPNVTLFAADPQVVEPGQIVIVAWDVQDAERVTIDQFGDVPPQGQREFRPEQTTDFRLVATGGGKESVRIERVNVVAPTSPAAPTDAPAPLPTDVPAPLPTDAPTSTPVPSEAPVPTVAPTSTPLPAPEPVDLLAQASDARWGTSNDNRIPFGRPDDNIERGGWTDVITNVTLENGQQYQNVLVTFPPTDTITTPPNVTPTADDAPFIEGLFILSKIQLGQFLLADVGFPQDSRALSVTVRISFGDEIIYEEQKQPDGKLLPISVDLTQFAGRAGRLYLRVSATGGPAQDGLYWLQPRIDLPSQ